MLSFTNAHLRNERIHNDREKCREKRATMERYAETKGEFERGRVEQGEGKGLLRPSVPRRVLRLHAIGAKIACN